MKLEQQEKKTAETNPEKKFRYVKQITKQEYIREVNEAGKDIKVVLHLYKDHVDECVLLNNVLNKLAVKYPKIKFLKGISDKIVPDFPDRQLPYILYYKNGTLQKGIQRLEFKMAVGKVSEYTIRNLLSIVGIEELKIEKEETTVKSEYINKLGWKKKKVQAFESDSEEEREFVTNNIQFK